MSISSSNGIDEAEGKKVAWQFYFARSEARHEWREVRMSDERAGFLSALKS